MAELRIVAGRWRGRRIAVPPSGVRPTADRVRESWMSIVAPELPDMPVLDLCAGSGALGLEALSRGASHCDFVEQAPSVLKVLRQNIAALGAEKVSTVHAEDAEQFADGLPSSVPRPYHVAFADPPYASDTAAKLAAIWLATPFSDIFCVEHRAGTTLPVPADGPPPDVRRYGDTALTIYRIAD